MHAARFLVAALLAACGGSQPNRTTPAANDRSNDFLRGCSCERLNAPIQAPTDAVALARWEDAAGALDVMFAELAVLFPKGTCGATINDDVAHVLAAHAEAIREGHALDEMSCDHFARWRGERMDMAREVTINEAMRGVCRGLSESSSKELSALLIRRGCTTVSLSE